MKTQADDWPKAPLNGVLIASVIFLTFLPSLGWAWHRVLPEHTHVYIGVSHLDGDEMMPAAPSPDDAGLCLDCKTPAPSSGIAHLLGADGLQVLGVAATLELTFLRFLPPDFSERVVSLPFLYRSPIVSPPDPPPNSCA